MYSLQIRKLENAKHTILFAVVMLVPVQERST